MVDGRKILLCADGSENSVRASQFVTRMMAGTDAHVTLLHVVTPRRAMDLRERCDDWEAEAKKEVLRCIEAMAKSDLDHEVLVQIGAAADVILEMSRGYDVIVMGYKGQGAITSVLMGSVTNKIVRESRMPVTLVP